MTDGQKGMVVLDKEKNIYHNNKAVKKKHTIKCAVLLCAVLLVCSGCGNKEEPVDVTKYEHEVTDNTENKNDVNQPSDEQTPDITSEPTDAPDNGADVITPEVFTRDGMNFTPVNDTIKIAASKVNIRTGPSTDYEIVYTAKENETFKRTADGDGNWDQIEYNGQLVYIYSPYISVAGGGTVQNSGTSSSSTIKKSESIDGLTVVDVSKQKYTYDEMVADLKELEKKYPDYFKINSLTLTKDGRNVYEAVLGSANAEKHIIIQASIHAREYMTTLVVMKQLEYYLAYMDTGSYNGTSYKDLFNSVAIHVVPMVNPDGVSLSQSGLEGITRTSIKKSIKEWYERDYASSATTLSLEGYIEKFKANANGVDLNRNFDYGWDDFAGAKAQSSEKYKGVSPASEPETAALVALTEQLSPAAAISYHASGSVIYWDYGQDGELKERCSELVKQINLVTGYEIKTAANDPQDAAGYGDWCVMVKNIPSATIEIGTGSAPLAISEFSDIWNRNWQVPAMLAWQYK